MRELVANADVLVENYKVGGLPHYGLDYASLKADFRAWCTARSPVRPVRTPMRRGPATTSWCRRWRAPCARVVADPGPFALDHVGAEIAEHLRRPGACESRTDDDRRTLA